MTKLYNYLMLNEDRSQSIFKDKAINLIKNKCSDIVKYYKNDGNLIYRGVESGSKYMYVEPSKSERVSRNTKNYYTLLIDNLSIWKDYPKRSKSIICTSKESVTMYYGNPYVIFPFNGSKIGVCSEEDFWISFSRFELSMDVFNDQLENILNNFKYTYDNDIDGYNIDWNTLKNRIVKVDDWLETFKEEEIERLKEDDPDFKESDYSLIDSLEEIFYLYDNDLFKKWISKSKKLMSLFSFIEYLLDPKANGFKIIKVGNKLPNESDNKELWTDGNCVMIALDEYNEVISNEI